MLHKPNILQLNFYVLQVYVATILMRIVLNDALYRNDKVPNYSDKKNLLVNDGKCLPSVDTAVANMRPKSAITVNVNGIPISAKNIQNVRPLVVTGTMLP